MSPTGNLGSATGRTSTSTCLAFRMCRASRAVSHTCSMSRRMSPTGSARSTGWGPGEGLETQKSVLRERAHDRGAGNRFKCFFTISSLLVLPASPGVRVVHLDDHEVRGVHGARDLLLVRLL